MLQGDGGYSRKSERGQASYYYSQPFFKVTGRITIEDTPADVTGRAWMDREWSSQPLASDQTGWDWFALHLDAGEKLMLYRMRQNDGHHYLTGNWISPDGQTRQLAAADIGITPKTPIEVAGRKLPVQWQIAIPSLRLASKRRRSIRRPGWARAFPIGKARSIFMAVTQALDIWR